MVYLSTQGVLRYRRKSQRDTDVLDNFNEKDVFGILTSADLPEFKQEILDVNNIGTGREKIYTTVRGKIDLDGTLNVVPTEPRHLRFAFGDDVVTGTTVTTKTATYKPINRAHLPGLELDAVLKDSPGLRRLYTGVVMRSIDFSAEEGGVLETEIGLQAFKSIMLGTTDPLIGNETDISGTDNGTDVQTFSDAAFPFNTLGATEPRPYIFSDAEIKLLSGAVTFCNTKSARIGIDNNVLSQHYLCRTAGRFPADIISQRPAFTAEITIFPEDRRLIKELYSGSVVFDVSMEFSKETSEAAKNLITKITAKDCFIEEAPAHIPEDGPIEQPITLHPRSVQLFIQDERTTVDPLLYEITDADLVSLNNP